MQKIDHNDPLSKSADIVSDNIQKLQVLFPEVFKEGKIDWQELQATLGEHIDTENERFNFTWNGKSNARKEAQKPSTGTLRPAPEESVDWDTTQNLYIEGDNLEVLKLLQKSYHQKVKMIYIDPPYNTGKDFVYKDNYKDNLSNYLELTGQTDDEGKKLSTNSDASGRYHSNWLNMMYPRLKLARNLLKDDGVIFISIDDHEVDNLIKICNEVFGEENFRNNISVRRRSKSLNLQFASSGLSTMNVGFEYILVYSKTNQFLMNPIEKIKLKVEKKGKWNVFWSNADRPTMRYEILGFTPKNGQWRWSKEKAEEAIENYNTYLKVSDKYSLEEYWELKGKNLKFVRRIENGTGKNGGVQYWVGPKNSSLRTTNWTDIEVSEIHKEFDLFFSNPKSKNLVKELIKLSSFNSNKMQDLILDMFSGSATTAHAVMELNTEDGGNRKHIQIQLPEAIEEINEAYKAGYKTIAEIGKERIRKAGNKIKEEHPDKAKDLDLGFKVFKLDSSNIKAWSPEAENLEQNLLDAVENIKEGRNESDLLYEILLKYGLDLTLPITEHTVADAKVFNVGAGALLVCLSDDITVAVAEGIAELKNKLNPEICRVVFKDNGFKDSAEKTNVMQKLKQHNIDEVRSI